MGATGSGSADRVVVGIAWVVEAQGWSVRDGSGVCWWREGRMDARVGERVLSWLID